MQIHALQHTNCRGEVSVYFYTKTADWRSPILFGGCQFTFWRAPIYILEAEIVLGVLYRKGVIPKKGGTLGSRERFQIICNASPAGECLSPPVLPPGS